MHPQIESLFDEAENRYLKAEELQILNQYVDSLPQRLETYQVLRNQELLVMQQVADLLQAELAQEKINVLERCIKNALLVMRYCAMGMLLNDQALVEERLKNWVRQMAQTYNVQHIDSVLYKLLGQQLQKVLDPHQMELLQPHLQKAQQLLLQSGQMP